MPVIPGEHKLTCARCLYTIYASEAKLHYLGFYTCSDCVQHYPDALRPIPKLTESPGLPAWKINVQSQNVAIDPHDTWDTSNEVWSTSTKIWDEY